MADTDKWYLERIIWLVAGSITLISTIGAWLHSQYWLILTAFVGVNLLIFAFSGFCIMANILYRLGARPRTECELSSIDTSSNIGNNASNKSS